MGDLNRLIDNGSKGGQNPPLPENHTRPPAPKGSEGGWTQVCAYCGAQYMPGPSCPDCGKKPGDPLPPCCEGAEIVKAMEELCPTILDAAKEVVAQKRAQEAADGE